VCKRDSPGNLPERGVLQVVAGEESVVGAAGGVEVVRKVAESEVQLGILGKLF
jgi:hypothetical protein